MEWTQIKAKWHDIAQRMQQALPETPGTSDTAPDAINAPVRMGAPHSVLTEAVEQAARAMI